MRVYINGNLYGFNEEDVIIVMLDGVVTTSVPDGYPQLKTEEAARVLMQAIVDEGKEGCDEQGGR